MDYGGGGQVVVVTPEEDHWDGDLGEVVLWGLIDPLPIPLLVLSPTPVVKLPKLPRLN